MGCTSSRLDDLPAVALCRERCQFLEEAIQQRYALADAHMAYISSLKEIGISLDRFFNQDLDGFKSLPSPVLNLPPRKKGDPDPVIAPSSSSPPPAVGYNNTQHHNHSHSNSGSHLHFHSDDDDEDDDDDESLHRSGNSSPLHYHHEQETLGGGFMSMNYMKNQSTQSVVYQQRPMSPDTVHMAQASSSYYPYPYPNGPNHENPNPYPYYNNNSYPPGYSNYGFYGSAPAYGSSPPQAPAAASSSKAPLPPPPPPTASPWDFLNPFETFEKYYPPTTSSRDSREVREEEGIPDLEDENYQDEVVKEVHSDQKFSDGGGNNYSKMVADEEKESSGEALYQTRPSASAEKEMQYEVHLVDKVVVPNEVRSDERGNVTPLKARGVLEVLKEIRAQFERASESGNEVSKILEAGKLPHQRKNAVYQVSSKMLHSITPSLSVVSSQPSTSKGVESSSSAAGSSYLDFEEESGTSSSKLSSTLQKLYIWEKKLYGEVKSEEKMRMVHERKSKRLKHLVEKGAEAPKIDSTRTLVRTLSTKIRIAIQVVDKISVKINKLRDEELWPQINELINGLVRMWKVMRECHQSQSRAVAEAKNLDASASSRKLSDANLGATFQLELELLNWTLSFSRWIAAQKGYVTALNSWLLKCLFYEPEETDDGIRPFSPSSIGAPPVFVICNQWSQAMGRISEKEVIDAMRGFSTNVLQLWEQHNLEMRQRMIANKDMDARVKALEREEQKMQKAVQAMEKQMVLVSGHQGGTASSSLSSGLKLIFEAMEKFTANSMQAYEELQLHTEEDMLARENMKVP